MRAPLFSEKRKQQADGVDSSIPCLTSNMSRILAVTMVIGRYKHVKTSLGLPPTTCLRLFASFPHCQHSWLRFCMPGSPTVETPLRQRGSGRGGSRRDQTGPNPPHSDDLWAQHERRPHWGRCRLFILSSQRNGCLFSSCMPACCGGMGGSSRHLGPARNVHLCTAPGRGYV